MLKKLFGLFKNKLDLDMTLDELEQWLKSKNKGVLEALEPICKELLKALDSYINELKEELNQLENAEIKDKDKIEQRIVSIVLGNRKGFISQCEFFIKRIDPPRYEDVNQIIGYSKGIRAELENFSKITYKSFYASQHLFYKEVENIKKTIKNVSKLNEDFMNHIELTKVNYFKGIEENIISLKSSIENKFVQLKKLNELKLRLNKVIEDKEGFGDKVEELRKSPNYKNYSEDKKRLGEAKDNIKKHKLGLEHNFSVIDYALKKYTHIADEEFRLINNYQKDPFDALLKDKEFKIIEVLQKLIQKVLENRLVIRDSKKQKILTEINKINKSYLDEILREYKELEKEKRRIDYRIKENKIIEEIEEIENRIEELSNEKESIERDIKNTYKNVNKIEFNEIRTGIEEQFDDMFQIKLRLRLIEDDK